VRGISRVLILADSSEPMFFGVSENAASLAGRLTALGEGPARVCVAADAESGRPTKPPTPPTGLRVMAEGPPE
jgi:hypothetical protein